MINKIEENYNEVLSEVFDGAHLMIGGQSGIGIAESLLKKILEKGTKNLTIIANHAGLRNDGIKALIRNDRVSKIICSFPRRKNHPFPERYYKGDIKLEIVPQGTLSERIRAGGAGIGGFYTPTGVGTILAEERETRIIDGLEYKFEKALKADFSLIKAFKADRWGNLVYHRLARNYNPSMATAAKSTIVEVDEIVGLGELNPESIITPGIFVDKVIKTEEENKYD